MPGRPAALVLAALAVTASLRAESPPPQDRPVFRLSVSLVQLDAVVTDRRGRHVTTLGRDDFEVLQDGRSQPVAAAAYIHADETWEDASGLPPLAPEALVPADARRTIALVVDDLRMSFVSLYYAREALRTFISRDLIPSDRVALVTTSGAPGSSAGFAATRVQLQAAAARLRFSLHTPAASVLDPIGPFPPDPFETFREGTTAEAALRRISDVVRLVGAEGGRKTVILVSEGFAVGSLDVAFGGVRDGLRRLVDRANRAGVVVYALDPRGLAVTSLSAADAVHGASGPAYAGIASARSFALAETQAGLRYLAGETGGFAIVNSNDLVRGLGRILEDQRGYYLIGYEPEAGTFGPGSGDRYRTVRVRVKRPGLRVRARTGFYGRTTE